MCTTFCLNLCKKKSMQLKLFLPYKFERKKPFGRHGMHDYPRAVIGESPWLSFWLVKVTDRLFTRRICKMSFCAKSLVTHQTAWRCTARLAPHDFSVSCRSEFSCFHNHLFGVKHDKFCNFELLSLEIGRRYLTSFLIYCRKNCALSVSINNQPQINVRKNRCSSNHRQLCFMWKSENKFIGI